MCATPEVTFLLVRKAAIAQREAAAREGYGVVGRLQMPRQPDEPRPPKPTHLELLEQRMAELEREAARVEKHEKMKAACASCKFAVNPELGWTFMQCSQPLVVGFDKPKSVYLVEVQDYCTDERLLWEPRPTRWERFIDWLMELWS